MTDATLDRHISAVESGNWWLCSCRMCMKSEHDELAEAGLLDHGQPTRFSHHEHVEKMTAPFTKEERWMIRQAVVHQGSASQDDES